MGNVLRIIADYQWWLYGLLGLLLLFYLWRALVARRESTRSIFKLEQEESYLRYSRRVRVSVLIVLTMAAVFAVSNLTTPATVVEVPVGDPTPTATTGPLVASTLTPTPLPSTITPTPTATAVRPTRPVRPTDTPEVIATEAPDVRSAACADANARLTSPGINQIVQGNFPIRGTANIANFQYYKVEVGPGGNPGENQWTVVGQLHKTPVVGGVLETFNSGAYPSGTYSLRLVVVDQTGNYPEPCQVAISVQR